MKHSLLIQLSHCEGAVIRALGLIERRGYRLESCSVGEADGATRAMEVTVTSTRPGDLLRRQLERLHDVVRAELLPAVLLQPQSSAIRPVIRRN